MPSALLFSSSHALSAFREIFPPLRVFSLRCWTGAPCFSPLLLPLIGHWCCASLGGLYCIRLSLQRAFSCLPLVHLLFFQLSSIHSALCALSLLSARLERWDNTERKEEEERGGEIREGWRCRAQGGGSHSEVYRTKGGHLLNFRTPYLNTQESNI